VNLLVLGATGATGKQLVAHALAAGHRVRAVVRDPAKIAAAGPNLEVRKGDVTSAADLADALRGVDAVVSTLGPRVKTDAIAPLTAAALVQAMKAAGVKRLVWLSAGGVGDSAGPLTKASWVFGRIIMPLFLKAPYANHLRAEESIRASGLDFTIVRPVQLVDSQTGNPVGVAPDGQPPKGLKISRSDVAKFMLDEVGARAHVGKLPVLYA